jgi:ketosteroid isomerase-like protein
MQTREDAVAEANQGFYHALESLDLKAMERVWSPANYVQCGHPGWPILRGWAAVIESWRRIFANTAAISFRLTDVVIEIRHDMAWVTLYENITNSVEGEKVRATVLTTNIFENGRHGWRMIHHHGSPVAQPPTAGDSTTVH